MLKMCMWGRNIMTDAELKKLKRSELLQMLLEQSKTVESLKAELEEKNRLLKERSIKIAESGSIAEAALKLNDVFKAAQKAADQYLHNIEIVAKKNQSDND